MEIQLRFFKVKIGYALTEDMKKVKINQDIDRVIMVIIQIIVEQIKYLREGTIYISSFPFQQMDNKSPDTKLIVFSIQDTGKGMAQEEINLTMSVLQENLYQKIDNNLLGRSFCMLMCHQLCCLLAPSEVSGLNIESVENQGTMFWFIIENHDSNQEILQ